MSYSDLEYEIFSRQFILRNFNEENIDKLNKAKITIVGLGGIGCPLTQYLVSSGIKNLTFFDGDKIEKSNLARQTLYTLEDIGKYKTSVAKEKLLKTNPNCNIVTYTQYLKKENLNLLLESDIIIDTTDDWHTSKIINEFCSQNSLKYIFSSAVNNTVQICLFDHNNNNDNHVCLNCIFPNEEDVNLARCETVGIASVCAGIAGLVTTQKTINTLLHNKNENNILSLIDTEDLSISNIKIKNNVNCVLNNS
jgi:adenylyltransferase/sulfurtransferase